MKLDALIISFLIAFLLTACSAGGGSGGGSSSESSVVGLNLSGTWRLAGIECYDSSLQNLTATGTLTSTSSVGTSSITGNQMTSEDLGTGSCKVAMNRSIVANILSGNSSGGYGTGTFGATSASITPSSSCSLTTSFNMSLGSVTPSTINSTYTQGQAVSQQTFEFLINPPYLAITSLIQVVGRPTDICFLIIQKL